MEENNQMPEPNEAPTAETAEVPLSPELQAEQEALNAKIAGYGNKVKVKAGISGSSIDYSKYIGQKVKIKSVTVGMKPKFWKDGKKYSTPQGYNPCFVITPEQLDEIDNGDGTKTPVELKPAKLNAYFIDDPVTGEEVLSFTKDDKGAAFHFCRVMGVNDPFDAVGMFVEVERQLNKDPEDTRVWLQMRI